MCRRVFAVFLRVQRIIADVSCVRRHHAARSASAPGASVRFVHNGDLAHSSRSFWKIVLSPGQIISRRAAAAFTEEFVFCKSTWQNAMSKSTTWNYERSDPAGSPGVNNYVFLIFFIIIIIF